MAGYTTYNSNQRLQAFARVDGSGRIIPSSVVFRKKKPTSGKWIAVTTYTCCTPTTTTTTSTTTTTTTTHA